MSTSAPPASGLAVDARPATPPKALVARLGQDEGGTTAVEFGLIAVPFFTMLMGLISVCLYFFIILELENAVWKGSRGVRVGNYGNGTSGYAQPSTNTQNNDDYKKEKLRSEICSHMRDPAACESKIILMMQSRSTISAGNSFTQPNCKNGTGDLQSWTPSSIETTGANSYVLLTACYKWELGGHLPMFKIGNMPDGSFLMQAMHAFRNESYN